MARPGFVHHVDDRTPPLAIAYGESFRLESLPLGTQVVYAPEPLPAVVDLGSAIDEALANPLDSAPLADRLQAGMKLTIAFDDSTATSPRMPAPDVRGRIIERVLSLAAAAGVDDVELIIGNGLNRRLTDSEVQHLVGERIFRSFFADGKLTHHDATTTGDSLINIRAAESDLLVYVHLATGPTGHGIAAVINGLGSLAGFAERQSLTSNEPGQLPVQIFQIEAVLDNNEFPTALAFLGKREWEWKLKDRLTASAIRRASSLTTTKGQRRVLNAAPAGTGVIQVAAGDPDAVGALTTTKINEQQLVEVKEQADVLITGVGHASPYSAGSIVNPILAAWKALGQVFNANTGKPAVRPGGAVIIYHPASNEFNPLHHPSYVDFFADVLTTSTDAAEIEKLFEAKYAEDEWYTHLYRTSTAFHGVHPFYLWYEIARAAEYVGDIIWVGSDRSSVERLGFRTATTLHDALEIVASSVGRDPKISYLHNPPKLITDLGPA